MKKSISVVVILTALLVILVGVTSVAAKSERKITGSWQWDWPGFHAWGIINVHETASGEVSGRIQMTEIKAGEEGIVQWEAHPICVEFYEYEGNPAASFVVQADRVLGSWWEGKVGQYWIVFVVDGGTPGREGDLVGATWDLVDWPTDDFPGCDFEEKPTMWGLGASVGGNLVIHDSP